jgi:hypothetical protein
VKQLNLPQPGIDKANNALDAAHITLVGATGSGKTSALKRLRAPFLPTKGDHVAMFDPYGDYAGDSFRNSPVKSFSSWAEFYIALHEARKKRTGFKIAISGIAANPENLDIFCQIIWSLGDGFNKPLYAVCEETARCVTTAGKAQGAYGECLTGGRKFNIRVVSLFQRGQEVPKTTLTQSAYKWIGAQEGMRDAEYLSKETDIPADQIGALLGARDNNGVAQYFTRSPGMNNFKGGDFKVF